MELFWFGVLVGFYAIWRLIGGTSASDTQSNPPTPQPPQSQRNLILRSFRLRREKHRLKIDEFVSIYPPKSKESSSTSFIQWRFLTFDLLFDVVVLVLLVVLLVAFYLEKPFIKEVVRFALGVGFGVGSFIAGRTLFKAVYHQTGEKVLADVVAWAIVGILAVGTIVVAKDPEFIWVESLESGKLGNFVEWKRRTGAEGGSSESPVVVGSTVGKSDALSSGEKVLSDLMRLPRQIKYEEIFVKYYTDNYKENNEKIQNYTKENRCKLDFYNYVINPFIAIAVASLEQNNGSTLPIGQFVGPIEIFQKIIGKGSDWSTDVAAEVDRATRILEMNNFVSSLRAIAWSRYMINQKLYFSSIKFLFWTLVWDRHTSIHPECEDAFGEFKTTGHITMAYLLSAVGRRDAAIRLVRNQILSLRRAINADKQQEFRKYELGRLYLADSALNAIGTHYQEQMIQLTFLNDGVDLFETMVIEERFRPQYDRYERALKAGTPMSRRCPEKIDQEYAALLLRRNMAWNSYAFTVSTMHPLPLPQWRKARGFIDLALNDRIACFLPNGATPAEYRQALIDTSLKLDVALLDAHPSASPQPEADVRKRVMTQAETNCHLLAQAHDKEISQGNDSNSPSPDEPELGQITSAARRDADLADAELLLQRSRSLNAKNPGRVTCRDFQ